MVSIIIPAYKEPYINRTIASLLENAAGEVEILAVLDGYVPEEPVRENPRVKVITLDKNQGMRASLNAGLAEAKGEFIMKMDAHCSVGRSFDKILTNDCAENQLMIPRRYSLDEKTWTRDEGWPVRDYHYLRFPQTGDYGYSFQVQNWPKTGELEIDDTMTFQGSAWIANRKYFMEHVGYHDDRPETYGSFGQDQQEVGLKYWLGGGEVKVNKKTWYAHFRKLPRHYNSWKFSRKHKKDAQRARGDEWATKHWMNNKEPNMIHPFSWLIEKFWPVPTWPEDRSLWRIV